MRYDKTVLAVPTEQFHGYSILDPDKIKYVERDDFIKSLEMRMPPPEKALEDIIIDIYNTARQGYNGTKPRIKISESTLRLAQDYIYYRDLQARLPKFSRWACGMFQGKQDLAQELAEAGKYIEKSGDISISGSLIDILRCADSPYFYSCFSIKEAFNYMPKLIAECTPGIGIAYVDDPSNGKMRGRCWVHHAKRLSDGVDVAVICEKQGGTVSARQIGELIKAKGIPAYVASYYNQYHGDAVEFVNCFDSDVHHDLATWHKPYKVSPI